MIVGVTGHRPNRIPAGKRSSAALRIRAALISFDKKAERHKTPILISGLAEGSDRYAAGAALKLGWELHALLPLAPEDYLQDFESPASKGQFRRFLAAAASVSQPSEDARRTAGGDAEKRPYCYLAQGLDMLSQINGLIAVWDGGLSAGVGGTLDIIERAQAKDVLVHFVRI